MGEELRDFRDGVIAQALADRDPKQPQARFADLAGQMLEESEELSDYMACSFRGSGARRRSLGIDGYAFDDADDSLCAVIALFDGATDPITLTQTSAKAEFAKLTAFLEEAIESGSEYAPQGDQPAADFAELIQSHRGSITRLRLYLVSDGLLSDRIRDWPESEICGIPAEFHIWDISRFHAAASSRMGREALSVDFAAIVPGGVPCLHASLHQSDYSGYLCVLPGEALAAIYDRYGSRLLEGNVRSFLGKTGKVNKAMRETILRRPAMFFAFNNGIAATATAVDVALTQDGPRLIQATDLQIVNGGQTTASLAFSRRKDGADLSGIFVQMKLSVVSESLAGELIPKISEYANKQNKVSDSDLFSNHEYHRQLEALSRRIPAPPKPGSQKTTVWFYERARGQYRIETATMSPGERARFEAEHPKGQVINKTDLAKIENSWLRRPVDVSKGAQKNFDSFSKYIVAEWAANLREDSLREAGRSNPRHSRQAPAGRAAGGLTRRRFDSALPLAPASTRVSSRRRAIGHGRVPGEECALASIAQPPLGFGTHAFAVITGGEQTGKWRSEARELCGKLTMLDCPDLHMDSGISGG